MDVFGHVQHSVRVSCLVVVPRDHFEHIIAQIDSCIFIDNGTVRVCHEVLRDHLLISVP